MNLLGGRRPVEGGVQRRWHVEPDHHRHGRSAAGLGLTSSTPTDFDTNASINTHPRRPEGRDRHPARRGVELRFEPVGRSDPPGLHQEHDQHPRRPVLRTSPSPTPTRKPPTCSPCRPASSCLRPPCRWPRRPTRTCSACSSNPARIGSTEGGPRPAFSVSARQPSIDGVALSCDRANGTFGASAER